jgi:hypothetical protein
LRLAQAVTCAAGKDVSCEAPNGYNRFGAPASDDQLERRNGMGKVIAEPRRPAECWQQRLDEWIEEVQGIIGQAKEWAEKRDWAAREDQKVIAEENIGTYEAPTLLIHTAQGRLMLDPIARSVVGADGRIDFCAMPSYDGVPLVKAEEAWEFLSASRDDLRLPWCEESFEKVSLELLKMQ